MEIVKPLINEFPITRQAILKQQLAFRELMVGAFAVSMLGISIRLAFLHYDVYSMVAQVL